VCTIFIQLQSFHGLKVGEIAAVLAMLPSTGAEEAPTSAAGAESRTQHTGSLVARILAQRRAAAEAAEAAAAADDVKEREAESMPDENELQAEKKLKEEFLAAKEAGMAKAAQEDPSRPQNRVPVPPSGGKISDTVPKWITPEEYKELGYPEYDARFRDKEWMRTQMELERTDPRVNPNLLKTEQDDEFWYNAARKPINKAILKTEECWNNRRQTWLAQYKRVMDCNNKREVMAELLNDCSNEVRRLITPIFKYRIVESVLSNCFDLARARQVPFQELVESKEYLDTLQTLRNRIDLEGEKAAEELMAEYDARLKSRALELVEKKELQDRQDGPRVADASTLTKAMNWGEKCKKDGMIEWEKGNLEEACRSWRQGDDCLRRVKAPPDSESETKLRNGLHISILKNLAQVCIKLQNWNDALEAAKSAVALDDQDHKAWFRKACALEGLGRIQEANECLDHIDDIAVGRADRARISKDTQAKRDKYHVILDRDRVTQEKMAQDAIQKEVFSAGRVEDDGIEFLEQVPRDKIAIESGLKEETRKKLTKEGVEDLLRDLRDAYSDTTFQKQVFKLSRDVRRDKSQFTTHLKKLALTVQKPVLEKWGFEESLKGVLEMTRAVQDHTRGKASDSALVKQAEDTRRVLYGDMYEIVTRPQVNGVTYVPRMEVRLRNSSEGGDSDDNA